jgi:hypothetical protein
VSIDDDYWAWCLDEAVFMYGKGVENLLNQAENGAPTQDTKAGARMMKLEQLLDFNPFRPVEVQKQRFADPARVRRKPIKKVVKT